MSESSSTESSLNSVGKGLVTQTLLSLRISWLLSCQLDSVNCSRIISDFLSSFPAGRAEVVVVDVHKNTSTVLKETEGSSDDVELGVVTLTR